MNFLADLFIRFIQSNAHPKKRGGKKRFTQSGRRKGNGWHRKNNACAQSRPRSLGRFLPRLRGRVGKRILAFHGTPSSSNAGSIFRHGWMTGGGNAYGDGVYFATDPATAKGYAGGSGVYLKCLLFPKRVCNWNTNMDSQFRQWCSQRGTAADNSAKTAFLIHQGFDCLHQGNIVVMLAPQYANPAAWKRKNFKIRILSVHQSSDDRKIRV